MERLVEYLQDMAMSRGMDAELPCTSADSAKRAQGDAAWLDALTSELDAACLPLHSTSEK
jgi:hypothetical protein